MIKPDFNQIIFNNKVYSSDDIKSGVKEVKDFLKQNPLRNKSPFVYLYAENHIKTVLCYFGIIGAGYSCVLIDPDSKKHEIDYMMNDTPPFGVFRFNKLSDTFEFSSEFTFCKLKPDITVENGREYTLVYTAADDGYAKAAMLSQNNLISNSQDLANINNAAGSDTICSMIPLSHMFSWITGIFTPIFTQSSVLISELNNLQRADILVNSLSTYSVNYLYTIPIVLFLLARQKDCIQSFKTLKFIISGGYKLPPMIYNSYKKKFFMDIHEGYGLTEASPVCTWHRPDDTIKLGSVGRNFPGVRLKTIDDDQNDLDLNSIGEICIRGKNVMEGYYNKPDTNKKIFRDSWLKTGDLGYLDNEKYLFLTGLKKRMYNVGGRNVYHKEIIRYLENNNNVEHVEITADHNEFFGHRIEASIVLKKNNVEEQNLFTKWCIDNISAFKLPKVWNFM